MALGHAQVGKQQSDRLGDHGGTAVGVASSLSASSAISQVANIQPPTEQLEMLMIK